MRLVIRFDDFGARNTPKPPQKPPQLRGGKGKDTSLALQVVPENGRLVLAAADDGAAQPGGPQKQVSSDDDRTHVIEGIIPARLTLHRNGQRTADTLSAEIKWVDMPIDPRVVRACALEVYLGTLSQEEYELGIRGVLRGDRGAVDNASEPLNVLPDTYLDEQGNQRSNLRFSGWVDEWEVEFPKAEAPVVRLECTDNTRLLLEQEAPPKLTVGADTPIDHAIANYLAAFPQFRGLEVEFRPAGAEVPMLGQALAKTAFLPKLGPAPAGGGTGKLMVWDYLTDVTRALGLMIRLEFNTIIVQRARTYYGAQFLGRADDPFTGRVLPSGREIRNRLFVLGRNIDEMSFRRKFARFAPFNVEVRCYSGRRKKTLVARYPVKGDRQKRLLPGNAADEKWVVFPVSGIDDEKTLRVIAQGIYETVGRNELEARFVTKNLASYGGGNLDVDGLDVLAGDAIDIEVNREREEFHTIAAVEEEIAQRAEGFLRSIGYEGAFATAYGVAMANVGFPSTFRVRAVTIDWDANEEGITVDMEATNYVEVRADKLLPAGEELVPSDSASATPVRVKVGEVE